MSILINLLVLFAVFVFAQEQETVSVIAASDNGAMEDSFTCVLLNSGHVKCVGAGTNYQLGYGDLVDRDSFATAEYVNFGTDRTVERIYVAADHYCVQLDNHGIKCVGLNDAGQLGSEDLISRPKSALETGDALPYVDIGDDFVGTPVLVTKGGSDGNTCVLVDGKLKCWGGGELYGYADNTKYGGSPGTMGNNLPFIDFGDDVGPIEDVSLGIDHACVMFESKLIKCFGAWWDGDLGYGTAASKGKLEYTMGNNLSYVDIGAHTAKSIHAFSESTCVLTDLGEVLCWGRNTRGVLGIGVDENVRLGDEPNEMGTNLVAVDFGTSGFTIDSLAFSYGRWCAKFSNSKLKCIGDGYYGALGNGLYRGDQNVGTQSSQMGDNLDFVNLGDFNVSEVFLGKQVSFAKSTSGAIKAWGYGLAGNTGTGNKMVEVYTSEQLSSDESLVSDFGIVVTSSPTQTPTSSPSQSPTTSPTSTPTTSPTSTPTASPTSTPTASPTSTPTTSPTSAPTTSPTSAPTTNTTGTTSAVGVSFEDALELPDWWTMVFAGLFGLSAAYTIQLGRGLSRNEPFKVAGYILSISKSIVAIALCLFIFVETYDWIDTNRDVELAGLLLILWVSAMAETLLPFAFEELGLYSWGFIRTLFANSKIAIAFKSVVALNSVVLVAAAGAVYLELTEEYFDEYTLLLKLCVLGSLLIHCVVTLAASLYFAHATSSDLEENASTTNFALLFQRQKAVAGVRFYGCLASALRLFGLAWWFISVTWLDTDFLDNSIIAFIFLSELGLSIAHAYLYHPLDGDILAVLRTDLPSTLKVVHF